ncbi:MULTISPECIES: YceD family protein [unclassified Flavobacterium]|uniref:YceD family protein n=1 Tax=unclassified Flavobacterium TaxID=196869 RepID=UPI003F91089D
MKNTKEFLIPFVGLKLGKHHFEYQLSNAFFEIFDYDEFEKSDVKVNVVLEKKSNMLELILEHKGSVNVPCDLTSEEFDLPIEGKMKLIVRFGDQFNNDNEELLILPFGEFEIDVAQYLYEMIVLSVPLRRVHPGVKDGSLKTEALDKLNELAVKEPEEEKEEEKENIDPRWDKLKQLLTDK